MLGIVIDAFRPPLPLASSVGRCTFTGDCILLLNHVLTAGHHVGVLLNIC